MNSFISPRLRLVATVILLLAIHCPLACAGAEPTDESAHKGPGTKIYEADFFAAAQVQTALDMLSRLPGFTFDPGDEDVRGFAGGSGNVLIDGQRPASKYDSLEDILERIKASSVVRIELIRGSAPGIDMQGQSVVANVIRSTDVMVERTLDAGLYQHADGRLMPEGALDSSWRRDGRLLETSVKAYEVNEDDSGDGYRHRVNTSGEVLRHELSDVEASEKGINATVGYEQAALGGNLRLNLALLGERKEVDEDVEGFIPPNGNSTTTERKDSHEAEFGMYYDRELDSGATFSLLALQHLLDEDKVEQEIKALEDTTFENDSRSGESVIRAVVSQSLAAAWSLEWGGEAAYNFLNGVSVTTENGESIPLPSSDVQVQEVRGEVFGNITWAPGEDFNLEAGLAMEYSTISQEGDTSSSKSLFYPKSSLLLNWSSTDVDQFRWRIEREVGQLDFDDFVTSAELATDTVDIGNPDLEPDTSWIFAFTWERNFIGDATSVLTLSRAWVSDVVDIVPIYVPIEDSDEFLILDGVGNIGHGKINEIQLGLHLPTDRFGITGGLLQADVTYRHSSVSDPLTGEKRSIFEVVQPWEGSIEWTQDLPQRRFRWGAEITLGESSWQYRIDEVRRETIQASVGLSAEYFPSSTWSVAIELQNLTRLNFGLEREIYDAPRNTGSVEAIEVQSWESAPYLFLRLHWKLK